MPSGFMSNDPTSFVLGSGWANYDRPSWETNRTSTATNNPRAYGSIPRVPTTAETQRISANTNLSNFPLLTQLARQTNTFNQGEMQRQYEAALPQYNTLTQRASANIGSNLAGTLPKDVITLLQQQAAERGVATGSPTSSNASAAYLRALGLNSLDLMNLGQQQLNQRVASTPVARLMDPSGFYITPENQWQATMTANTMAAAPDPAAAAAAAMAAARSGLGSVGTVGGGVNRGITLPNYGSIAAPDTGGSIVGGYTGPDYEGPYYGYNPSSIATNWSGYDALVGGYVDPLTGNISDTPGGTPWSGFNYYNLNTPAAESP